MWIEVFKTGTHTDANGSTRTWTEGDLDKIVANYDPAKHEAPVVLGHPADNAPAYGWVEALKREGGTLLAKLKQLDSQFQDWVRQGRFKKRSISLYGDMTLRHVGFLGAMPPAVKGLKDAAFSARDQAFFIESDFQETTPGGGAGAPPSAGEQPPLPNPSGETMNEEELKKQLAESQKREAESKAQAEKAQAELEAQKKAFSENQKAQQAKENQEFLEGLVRAGKVLPAEKASHLQFMEGLSREASLDFVEDGSVKKISPLDQYKRVLQNKGQHGLFSETPKHTGEPSDFAEVDAMANKIAEAAGCPVKKS